MNSQRLAAIDIGTNTFRLLIAEISRDPTRNSYTIREIHSERVITRLGEGIHESGTIKKEAMDRSIAALKDFCRHISLHEVHGTSVVATSALREARNSRDFLDNAKKVTELPITVISGEEEARITASGMFLDMSVPDTAVMVDIGGGSTELIFSRHGKPEFVHSQNTGVVYLAGKYMKHDPPLKNELAAMEQEITTKMDTVKAPFLRLITEGTGFIGTAGTVTALAAMAQGLTRFEHGKIHNFRLPYPRVKEIYSVISRLSAAERGRHIPFELSRLDIIVPGTRILAKLMEIFGFEEIIVSNYGLREGILIELYNSDYQKEIKK